MKALVAASALCLLALATTASADVTCEGTDPEKEKCLSKIYLDQVATEAGATVAPNGVVFRPIFVNAAGEPAQVTDTVTVGYVLVDREGHLIEQTEDEVATFPLGKLIQCWKTAIPMMTVGSLAKVTCPSDTAYGDRGAGDDIKGGAALTFRITLFGVAH